MTQYRFLAPLDLLFLRGNKLFGDAGSHGESLMPPWPSVAAGAIRSRMAVDLKLSFDDLKTRVRNRQPLPSALEHFAISHFGLGRCHQGQVEALWALPADLIASRDEQQQIRLQRVQPHPLPAGVEGSWTLPQVPLLAADERHKPVTGLWLNQTGWRAWLQGETPAPQDLVATRDIWQEEQRTAIALDKQARRAADGALFTTQAIAFRPGCGFLVGVDGAEPPCEGLLRLGGDGRAATISAVDWQEPEADLEQIVRTGHCRLLLTSPGLFAQGWLPPGCTPDGRFALGGIRGRLRSAAVPRSETISGWDLVENAPKPAQKAVPTGAVYWLDEVEASVEQLRQLMAAGLWDTNPDPQRRAEGFNRFIFAND